MRDRECDHLGGVPVAFLKISGALLMPEILDTNRNTWGRTDALKAAGVKTVIRYLMAGGEKNEKVIKFGEAELIESNAIEPPRDPFAVDAPAAAVKPRRKAKR